MKYCKVCKTAAGDTETVCPRGHPLSVFGASPRAPRAADPGATGPGPTATMYTLMGEVRKLEETRTRNVRRGRTFGALGLAAALAITFVLYQVYARTVLDYAVLENVRVEQDPGMDWTVYVSYDVKSPGKVAFDRRSGSRRIEKLDLTTKTGMDGFSWAWPSDPTTGIDFRVVYRGGWFRTSVNKHFNVTTAEPTDVN